MAPQRPHGAGTSARRREHASSLTSLRVSMEVSPKEQHTSLAAMVTEEASPKEQHTSLAATVTEEVSPKEQLSHSLAFSTVPLSPNASGTRRKRYKCRYKAEWTEQWPFILPVLHDPHRFFCSVCCREVSCSHQGKRDVERHISLMMHANNAGLQFEGLQPVDYRPPSKAPKLEPPPFEPKQEWIDRISPLATKAEPEDHAFDFSPAAAALPPDFPKFPSPPEALESPPEQHEPDPLSVMVRLLQEQRQFQTETKELLGRQMEIFFSLLEETKTATACLGRITAQNEAILRELRRPK